LLKTNEEQLSTDDITNICRRLDAIQKLEDTKFSKKRDAKFERDGIKPKAPGIAMKKSQKSHSTFK
jgi:hypothetical protein